MRSESQTVDIGHGRGRLAPVPAASVARIDAQLGRPADINSAWRDPELQQQLYDAWIAYSRYLAGGPWAPKAPRALPPRESVHCDGEAADSDDWYNAAAAAIWRDNGWRQTARVIVNGRPDPNRDEPWHGEHFLNLDNHRNDPAPAGTGKPITLEEIMTKTREAFYVLHEGNLYLGRQMGGLVHVQPVDLDVWSGGTQSEGYWNLDDGKPLMLETPPTFDTENNADAWASVVRFCGGPAK